MKKTIIFLFALALLNVSCDEFLDVNDNPNDPAISTPSLTLPVAQQSFVALNARTMTTLGNYLTVNWSTPSNWSANAIYSRYNFTSSDFTTIFETSYVSIFKNLTYIENYEDPSGAIDYSYYKAISKVIKGFQYQLLVDLYGDIPYSEANLRGANTTPAYDDAETVYKAVIDDLALAVDLIQNAPDNAEDPGSQDIIFSGNMDHWIEFANTIKLRMLVRLSNTGQDSYITSQIATIDANGGGYITSDVVANPGYTNSENKQNPFWDLYRNPVTGVQTSAGDFTVASEYAITFLETTTNDPRLERLYAPAANSGAFKGTIQNTVLPGTGFTSDDVSKVGPGLLVGATEDQVIMSLSEALFIQAEATTTARGYLPGGDVAARDLYEAAIEASFDYLGVDSDASDYYNQPILNVSWDNSPNKIEAIITQKWVALNGTSSIESWIDLTRTGYPTGLPIPAESDGQRPVRLLYPSSEIARNSDNVPAQTSDDVFTNFPFWK